MLSLKHWCKLFLILYVNLVWKRSIVVRLIPSSNRVMSVDSKKHPVVGQGEGINAETVSHMYFIHKKVIFILNVIVVT